VEWTPANVVATVTFVCGAITPLFRGWVIDALHDAGVYEKIGEPRRNFHSDTLFIRVLFVAGKGIRPVHRVLFKLYFAASIVFLIGALVLFWIGVSGRP
jgi:hypothetical protein